jgi:hypothetical protein
MVHRSAPANLSGAFLFWHPHDGVLSSEAEVASAAKYDLKQVISAYDTFHTSYDYLLNIL